MVPSLVAAMAFLASLALAGAVGAHLLAQRWTGAGAILTVQVPDPDLSASGGASSSRIDAVLAQLARAHGISGIHRLSQAELERLLRPWLGGGAISLPLPAVVQLRLMPQRDAMTLAPSLAAVAPGTLVEDSAAWSGRLLALTDSLQACAALALLTVGTVAGCVVMLATRTGIANRRQAIEIVHGLGATDSYIAGRFARRAGWLALVGGIAGALAALPVLAGLSHLAAPFAAGHITPDSLPGASSAPAEDAVTSLAFAAALPGMLPLPLLIGMPVLPLAAGLIGWLTAQVTVRVWLRRLP
jgi:cell division transport system permease protein